MKRLFSVAVLSLIAASSITAQEFKTSFFLDNYVYSYRLNPGAEIDDDTTTFFALGLGNVSASALTNSGVSKLFFPKDGELLFFLDESVSSDEFLSGIDDNNFLQPQLNLNVLTLGRSNGKSRFSLEVNVRSDTYAALTSDFSPPSRKVSTKVSIPRRVPMVSWIRISSLPIMGNLPCIILIP